RSERTRPFVRTRLGPEVAEVAAADALELAAALRHSGHLPRVDAALRLAAEPRRAYAGLVDEQVLEFLLVSLLAFRTAWPERLARSERTRPFVRTRLGPEVAEVAAADALELAAALRHSGHLPRVDAALRLAAEPRRAYAGLVDEQVLEFLLVSLLAFRTAWPERLARS